MTSLDFASVAKLRETNEAPIYIWLTRELLQSSQVLGQQSETTVHLDKSDDLMHPQTTVAVVSAWYHPNPGSRIGLGSSGSTSTPPRLPLKTYFKRTGTLPYIGGSSQ